MSTFTDHTEAHSRPAEFRNSPEVVAQIKAECAERHAATLARINAKRLTAGLPPVNAAGIVETPALPSTIACDALTPEQKLAEQPDAHRQIRGERDTVPTPPTFTLATKVATVRFTVQGDSVLITEKVHDAGRNEYRRSTVRLPIEKARARYASLVCVGYRAW